MSTPEPPYTGEPPAYGQQPYQGEPPVQGEAYYAQQQPYPQQPYMQQPYAPGPPPQQPYPYPYPYPPAPATNGMAIASMVLGILWLYWVGSILALIFGYIARNEIKKSGQGGDGMAIAGIVLGWVGVGILCAVLIIVPIAANW